jgi:hypothetical protein
MPSAILAISRSPLLLDRRIVGLWQKGQLDAD